MANLPLTWTLFRRLFNLRSFAGSSDASKTRSGQPASSFRSQAQRNTRSAVNVDPSDSQEQINKAYGIPLKIYQRHDVQVSTEPAGSSESRPNSRDEGLVTTTIKGGMQGSRLDAETASERSPGPVVNVASAV